MRMSDELKYYVVRLVTATRQAAGVQLGASPRASIALMKAAQALALFDGQEFVSPEHIHEVAAPVIAHRLVLGAAGQILRHDQPASGGRRPAPGADSGLSGGRWRYVRGAATFCGGREPVAGVGGQPAG